MLLTISRIRYVHQDRINWPPHSPRIRRGASHIILITVCAIADGGKEDAGLVFFVNDNLRLVIFLMISTATKVCLCN